MPASIRSVIRQPEVPTEIRSAAIRIAEILLWPAFVSILPIEVRSDFMHEVNNIPKFKVPPDLGLVVVLLERPADMRFASSYGAVDVDAFPDCPECFESILNCSGDILPLCVFVSLRYYHNFLNVR